MKILIIGPFPNPITGQSLSNEMFREGLKKNLHIVDYIDTNFSKTLTNKNLQGKFDITKMYKVIKKSFYECKKILLGNYDVIYMTPGGTYLGFLRFAHYIACSSIKNKKIYLHIHNGFFRTMYDSQSNLKRKILNFFLGKATGIIVLGESLKGMFKGIVPENKIFICENGVEDNFVATEEEVIEKVYRCKSRKKKKILYLSNLMVEKGILDLLKVSEYFTEEEIEINIAGAIEPSIEKEVRYFFDKYPNKLKYYGIVSGKEKKNILLQNNIFILPSYYTNEGQPISILEAYLNGCAVITDESIGGIKDIFKTNRNGIKCENRNHKNIFNVLKNINELEYMEKNYRYGKEKFLKEHFIDRLEKIIKFL